MRCVVYDRTGEPSDVLQVVERPEPREPGAGELIVRILARPIQPANLLAIRGTFGGGGVSQIPGGEAVGIVEQTGANCGQLRVGDRVVVYYATGTWAELVLVQAHEVFRLPPGSSIADVTAAQMVVNPLTALMLVDASEAKLRQTGGWLLQTAARSTVGRLVRSLAKARGLKVINLVRSEKAAEALRSNAVGSMHVVSTGGPAWRDDIRKIAGDEIDVVLDPVAGELSKDLIALLRHGGRFIPYGAMGGQPLIADPLTVAIREIHIQGLAVIHRLKSKDGTLRHHQATEVLSLLENGAIDLPVAAVFDLRDVAKAVKAADALAGEGKVILISQPS